MVPACAEWLVAARLIQRMRLNEAFALCLLCRRHFYDKRISQEVEGESLGEVRGARVGHDLVGWAGAGAGEGT